MTARRGEVWLVDFGDPEGREQAGIRPALVISTDALNQGPAGVLIVVPITSTRRDLPSHVELEAGESGLDETSYAKCEDVKSISDRRLLNRVGLAGAEELFKIERILRYLFEL